MKIELERPHIEHWSGILRALASYHFQVLGKTNRLDSDQKPGVLLEMRNEIHFTDLTEKTWVALVNGEAVGMCCWDWLDEEKREAKTLLIAVIEEARGTGAGFLLQQRRMQEMEQMGAVCVHTWSDHPDAIAWYKRKFGYREVGREPIRHAIHCFRLGEKEVWGIHRGFPQSEELAHLLLYFGESEHERPDY